MRISIQILSLLVFFGTGAMASEYKLEVQYPDHEVKDFAVPLEGMDVNLQKSKWHCRVDSGKPMGKDMTQGIISCKKGDSVAATWNICIEGLAANLVMSLSEPNNKSTLVFLKCNMK